MEDTTNVVMDEEFGVDLSDVVDEDVSDGNQTEETEASDNAEEEQPETEPAQDTAEEPAAAAEEQVQQEVPQDLYELKVNKEVQKVTMDQLKEYAQQGLDYGRIRQQRDNLQQNLNEQNKWRTENEGTLTELAAVAQAAGMDVPGLLNSLRVNMLVQQGMSREAAQERIRAERAERQVAENQKQASKQKSEQEKQEQMRQRVARDMQEFQQMYPGVDIRNVPQEVITEAASGRNSLVGAYALHQNKQLQSQIKELNAKIAAQQQNNNNRSKSMGSVRSSGVNSQMDSFLEGFND